MTRAASRGPCSKAWPSRFSSCRPLRRGGPPDRRRTALCGNAPYLPSEGLALVMRNGPMKRVLLIGLLVYFGEAFRNAVSLFYVISLARFHW